MPVAGSVRRCSAGRVPAARRGPSLPDVDLSREWSSPPSPGRPAAGAGRESLPEKEERVALVPQ